MVEAESAWSLSHVLAYRPIEKRRIPNAKVIEDDTVPQPDLVRFLKESYYEGADIYGFYLGRNAWGVSERPRSDFR